MMHWRPVAERLGLTLQAHLDAGPQVFDELIGRIERLERRPALNYSFIPPQPRSQPARVKTWREAAQDLSRRLVEAEFEVNYLRGCLALKQCGNGAQNPDDLPQSDR